MARKTPQERLDELKAAKAKLEAREKRIRRQLAAEKRKKDAHRKIVIGTTLLAHAEHDPEFKELLWTILNNHVMRPHDRKALDLPPLEDVG